MEERVPIVYDRQLAEWAWCPVALWTRYFGDSSLTDDALERVQQGKDINGLKNFYDEYEIEFDVVDSFSDQTTNIVTQLHSLENLVGGRPSGSVGIDAEDYDLTLASRKLNTVAKPSRIEWRDDLGWVVCFRRWNISDFTQESDRLILAASVAALREKKVSVTRAFLEGYDTEVSFDFEKKSSSRRSLELENLEQAIYAVRDIFVKEEVPNTSNLYRCKFCAYVNCPSRGAVHGARNFVGSVADIDF